MAGTLATKWICESTITSFLAIRAESVAVAVNKPLLASKLIAVNTGLCSFVDAANAVWETKASNVDFANVSCVPVGSKSKSGYSSILTQLSLYSERLSLTVAIVESITSKEISSDSIFLAISIISFALINVPPSLKFLMISTPLNLYGTCVLIVKS